MAAGYFGGYASKMQLIGKIELKHLHQSLERKIEVEKLENMSDAFKVYGKRLVKDLEGKGIIRTAVEGANLAFFADHPDVLMAECIRTFPSATFPAGDLLYREEVESGAIKGSFLFSIRLATNAAPHLRFPAPYAPMVTLRRFWRKPIPRNARKALKIDNIK